MAQNPFGQVEAAAFENYDDAANMFDADALNGFDEYGGKKKMLAPRRKLKSSFDLTFVNGSALTLKIELFNELNSFLKFQRTEFINGVYTYLPVSLSPNNLIAVGAGTVGYNNAGQLYVRGAANDGTQLTVSCSQFSMQGIQEASGKGFGFRVVGIRMTTTTDSQIDNEIVHTKSSFLGSKSQNRISPRTFFRPEQFQSKIVDIPLTMLINAEHGIDYSLNAGETVKWNVTIER